MITQIPNWQNLTDSDILVYLQETEWVPTNKQVLVADVVDTIGDDASRLVIGTMQAAAAQDPLMAAAYQAFTTVGISFSPLSRQALIDQLAVAGSWPDAVRDAVKALGGVYVKEWQRQGMSVEPTLESVTKQSIIDTARTAINSKATAINAWLDAADLSAYTEAELQAYVDGLLASSSGNGGGE